MASYRTGDGSKTVRFSETEARRIDEERGGGGEERQERYEPLPVMGGIKEKGFFSGSVLSAPVSLPNPSVIPFPVARHRSQGPHWLPVKKDEPSAMMSEKDREELGAEALSALAQPLVGKKKAVFSASRWKMKKSSDSPQEIREVPDAGTFDKVHEVVPHDKAPLDYAAAAQARNNVAVSPSEIDQSQAVPGGMSDEVKAIDADNWAAIAAMSAAEVVEAQTELMQRLKPEVLDMLRKRGLKKLTNSHAEDSSRSDQFLSTGKLGHRHAAQPVESVKTGSNETSAHRLESVKTGSNEASAQPIEAVKIESNETSAQPIEAVKIGSNETSVLSQELPTVEQNTGSSVAGKSWTERVEAVRLHKFDLEGNLLGIDEADDASSAVTLSEQSIAERDYLRSEGNPAAIGYSLKEATDLIRSTFPGHRVFALQLIAAVLNKAIMGIQTPKLCSPSRTPNVGEHKEVDWQAVWAYALGPEPQLVLTLRLALDDKHTTVVVACSKALQAILSYSANEAISDLHEAFWPGDTSAFTAPIFRRHTKPSEGFLGGGHWKYNIKTFEMFPFSERASSKADDDDDAKDTVGDDATVASKDVAAGFIRMGILPRIRFILEVEKIAGANEPLLSVVIALARHSPAAADAVMKCPRLMDSIIQQFFLTDDDLDAGVGPLRPAHTKAIQLLKVLLQASRMNCIRFAESGALQVAQCELYKQGYPMQLHSRLGEESFEGVRSTIIESLRLWRVCIHYQMGISLFLDIYPALCFWLAPLSSEDIASNNKEDALCLAQESYMLLESLAQTLPRLHSQEAGMSDNEMDETICLNWTWQVAIPLVETAIRWLSTDRVSAVTEQLVSAAYRDGKSLTREDGSRTKLIGTLASLFHFLATVSEKVLVNEDKEGSITPTPWLPTFIPQLGLLLASNGILSYRSLASEAAQFGGEKSTLFASLCAIRQRGDYEMSLAATSCLHGLVRLLNILDRVIASSRPESALETHVGDSSEDQQILFHGLVASGAIELRGLLALVGEEVRMNGHILQSCEENGRGGPAPGLALGWGSVGGGAWSKEVLVAQASARLAAELLEILPQSSGSISQAETDCEMGGEKPLTSDLMWRISCGFRIAAISDPKNGDLVEKAYSKFLLHPNVLECLFQNMECVLKGMDVSKVSGGWMKKALDLSSKLNPKLAQKLLLKNFRETWTATKVPKLSKRKDDGKKKFSTGRKSGLAPSRLATTVCEEEGSDACNVTDSLMREWARQRLPLPSHWLLSPMASNISQFLDGSEGDVLAGGKVSAIVQEKLEMEQVVKAGILWLLSLEALSQTKEESGSTFIATVPLIRKLHALSTVFVLSGDVFLHEDVREMVGTLQEIYGHQLDSWQRNEHTESYEWRSDIGSSMPLDFDHIDGNYSTFAETLSEQFGASSYGDLVFARQIAIYLRQGVPDSVRLAIWRGLADAHVLKLLPPLTQCCGQPWGYLYPFERNNQMIEAYVTAWTSGTYDAAVAQGSMSFALALHHIFGYIFVQGDIVKEKLALEKVIRTLVRSSTRKSQQQRMLKQLVEYQPPSPTKEISELSTEELDKRVRLLSTACEGDLSLVAQVERLRHMASAAR